MWIRWGLTPGDTKPLQPFGSPFRLLNPIWDIFKRIFTVIFSYSKVDDISGLSEPIMLKEKGASSGVLFV